MNDSAGKKQVSMPEACFVIPFDDAAVEQILCYLKEALECGILYSNHEHNRL